MVKGETSEMTLFASLSQPLDTLLSFTPLASTMRFIPRFMSNPTSGLTSQTSRLGFFQPLEQPVTLITDQSLPVAIALSLNSSGDCFDM
ncbi:Uncharacterised protein [Klebsiella pneumoniae]|nr:Uncharacterised protein [Klebsiella pneumoniae]